MKKFVTFSLICSFLLLVLSGCASNREIALKGLELSTDVNAKDIYGNTPLYYAVGLEGNNLETVKSLISKGADVNVKNNDGWAPLHMVAGDGHRDVAELLISRGADVNVKTNDDSMPLHYAASQGHRDVAELLISKGANVNAKDNKGATPLHCATVNGHQDIVNLLKRHGARE